MNLEQIESHDFQQWNTVTDKCLESLKSYTQSKSAWFRLAPE